jgi:hypothetical protein
MSFDAFIPRLQVKGLAAFQVDLSRSRNFEDRELRTAIIYDAKRAWITGAEAFVRQGPIGGTCPTDPAAPRFHIRNPELPRTKEELIKVLFPDWKPDSDSDHH